MRAIISFRKNKKYLKSLTFEIFKKRPPEHEKNENKSRSYVEFSQNSKKKNSECSRVRTKTDKKKYDVDKFAGKYKIRFHL